MQGMWDQVLLLELSGVGAVPFLCISSLLAAPKGVKGVKDFSEAALRLWELALFFCFKMQPMLKQPERMEEDFSYHIRTDLTGSVSHSNIMTVSLAPSYLLETGISWCSTAYSAFPGTGIDR